jgi:large subunit ribosomal protein L28
MAQRCDICAKRPLVGNNVSHANNKTKRKSYPNLRSVKVNQAGTISHLKVCARCLKAGKVVKAA